MSDPQEPDFSAQTGELEHWNNSQDWYREQARDAREHKQAEWFRFSYDGATKTLLIEGWKVRPGRPVPPP